MTAMGVLWRREWRLRIRQKGMLLLPVVFFLLVMTLFPLSISASSRQLAQLGAGATWIAALLAVLLGGDGLYRQDIEDGLIELWLAQKHSLWSLVLLKNVVHWLATCLPLCVLSLLAVPLFGLPASSAWVLLGAMLLGTPILSLLATTGAALTAGLHNSSLLAIVVLPLMLPVLILASGVTSLAGQGLPVMPTLALLAGLMLLAGILLPWAQAQALKLFLQ